MANYVHVLLKRKRIVHSFDWRELPFLCLLLPLLFLVPHPLLCQLLVTITEVMGKDFLGKNIDLLVLSHELGFYRLCQYTDS